MKRLCTAMVVVCAVSSMQLFAKKDEPNFSLKNKSDRKIHVTFKDRNNKELFLSYAQSLTNNAITINPNDELKLYTPHISNIGSLNVGYCDPAAFGPKYANRGNDACYCADEFDFACKENQLNLSYHTVTFGQDPDLKTFNVKFTLENGNPEVWAQEGRFGIFTPGRNKNISNGLISGNARKSAKK